MEGRRVYALRVEVVNDGSFPRRIRYFTRSHLFAT
jgi:hypothetical protein